MLGRPGSIPLALLAGLLAMGVAESQEVSFEYQVKAVYLFNFVKFIKWPSSTERGPITICVAERNPFGAALQDALRDEVIDGRPLEARVIREPETGCEVVFVPRNTGARPYIKASRGSPTLVVGEESGFLGQGGMINFILEAGSVRFEIDATAAEHAELRISSHLLRLARAGGKRG
jgi:hypothetical protein